MIYRLRLPLFSARIIVYVGDEEKTRYAKDLGVEENSIFDGSQNGKCTGSYLWLKEANIKTLAHEVSHFADNCMEHFGVEDKNGEVRAYIVGWAIDAIWGRIMGKNG